VFTLVIATGIVPWIIATGFLSNIGIIPPARSLLSFPSDLFVYPLARPVYCVLFAAFAIALAIARSRRFRKWRFAQPLRQASAPFSVLSLWILCGYASFLLLIPAASFIPERLSLSYWGPALLLGSVFCAVLARILLRSVSIVLAPAIGLLLLACTGHIMSAKPAPSLRGSWEGILELANYMNAFRLSQDTKLYAAPNNHLVLSFYIGMPFQSIAPVRKSFLDQYSGDLVYIEPATTMSDSILSARSLRHDAEEEHKSLTEEDAQTISLRLRTLDYRMSVLKTVGRLHENLSEPLPRYASLAFGKALGKHAEQFAYQFGDPPILRGFQIKDYHDWVAIFMYRFVDPKSRMGTKTNYAARLASSQVDILTRSGWAIYHCPRRCDRKSESLDFRILP
jgi:hypothetical protein